MTTLNDIVENMIAELNDDKAEILKATYPDDEVMEYVDSHVPAWNHLLINILQEEKDTLNLDDDGIWAYNTKQGAFNNVIALITACVYEQLSQAAYDWLYNHAEYNQ